jgi:hypothetical protein
MPIDISHVLRVTFESELRIDHILLKTTLGAHPDLDKCISRAGGQNLVAEWVELHIRNVSSVAFHQGYCSVELPVVTVCKKSKGGVAFPGTSSVDTVGSDTIIVVGHGRLRSKEALE